MSDKTLRRSLVERLRKMNHDLNEHAVEGALFDPHFSAEYTMHVEPGPDSPTETGDFPDGTLVVWGVAFRSGRGDEGEHLLSRKVEFSFRDKWVTDGVLEDDSSQRHDFADFKVGGPDEGKRLGKLRLHLGKTTKTRHLCRYIAIG